MRRLMMSLLLALALAGCVSEAEQRAKDEATCKGYGFKPDTDPFSKCLMSVDQNRLRMRDQDLNAMQMQETMMMAPGCAAGMCW